MNDTLTDLGWRDFFERQLTEHDRSLVPARVARQDQTQYYLLSAQGPLTGLLRGRTRIETESIADLPAVGDWVLCAPADESESARVLIERVLDRFSKFSRQKSIHEFDEQVVAANIDTVFIITGLDGNFNPNRIERYLVLAWNSSANPVVVLSKADLCDDADARVDLVTPFAMGAPIHVVSGVTGEGIEALSTYAGPGQTVALLGSSGVGKSTISNALLGYDRFRTGAVRAGDSKGRHTTTHRELCRIEGGGLLVDTPGMRAIQLWADEDTLASSFEDVEGFALGCRFTNCGHESEPGCAVRAAIEAGSLEPSRLDSYRKFQREIEHFAAKQDAGLRAEKRQARRKFTKNIRKRPTKRD